MNVQFILDFIRFILDDTILITKPNFIEEVYRHIHNEVRNKAILATNLKIYRSFRGRIKTQHNVFILTLLKLLQSFDFWLSRICYKHRGTVLVTQSNLYRVCQGNLLIWLGHCARGGQKGAGEGLIRKRGSWSFVNPQASCRYALDKGTALCSPLRSTFRPVIRWSPRNVATKRGHFLEVGA